MRKERPLNERQLAALRSAAHVNGRQVPAEFQWARHGRSWRALAARGLIGTDGIGIWLTDAGRAALPPEPAPAPGMPKAGFLAARQVGKTAALASAAPTTSEAADALLAAFRRGAGISPDLVVSETREEDGRECRRALLLGAGAGVGVGIAVIPEGAGGFRARAYAIGMAPNRAEAHGATVAELVVALSRAAAPLLLDAVVRAEAAAPAQAKAA